MNDPRPRAAAPARQSSAPAPTRVLLACSGLEHAHRGFESFARECFDALRAEPELEVELVKGSGRRGIREKPVRSLKRDSVLTRALGRIWGDPIRVEQLAFAFSLQPELLRRRPDVVYLSEWYTGLGLAALRRALRQHYALVLSNGSMAAEGFEPFDLVHQHTAPALEFVLARGADPAKQVLLPVGFKMAPELDPPSAGEREALRARLALPVDRPILVSVAALNRWHKRLDYVIEEVAGAPHPPFLLMVGQPEAETGALRALADRRLGTDGHTFRTVPHDQVRPLLRASDAFVLASVAEGLPRGLVEAMAEGLPCLAHDYAVSHYALGDHGHLADLTRRGELARLIETVLNAGTPDAAGARARHRFVYERFSWDRLAPDYVQLLIRAAGRGGEE